MSYELSGKLHKKYDTENKSGTFKSRDFVILDESTQYPQYIKLQIVQDRCELLDNIQEGTPVKVHFDLRGREWNEKFFTNLQAWRVEPIGAAPEPLKTKAEQDDDMPF